MREKLKLLEFILFNSKFKLEEPPLLFISHLHSFSPSLLTLASAHPTHSRNSVIFVELTIIFVNLAVVFVMKKKAWRQRRLTEYESPECLYLWLSSVLAGKLYFLLTQLPVITSHRGGYTSLRLSNNTV